MPVKQLFFLPMIRISICPISSGAVQGEGTELRDLLPGARGTETRGTRTGDMFFFGQENLELEQLGITPCAHYFCLPCLTQQVERNQRCGVCRHPLKSLSCKKSVVSYF